MPRKIQTKINLKVYPSDSTIPGIGKGLFAKTLIKKDSVIAEYKGKLRKPNEHILECPPNDLASYANDAINFTGKRRQLIASLKSSEPFYKKHQNANVNATIKINDNLHRAFLIASNDINIDEEIFCHYGFIYWFKVELSTVGFLEEKEIEENGFPEKIFEYEAFISYIRHFYDDYKKHEVEPYGNNYDFIIHSNSGGYYIIPMENFSNLIERVPES
jgi:SET domain-containing protein